MRVAIIGGTGFIGSALAEYLANAGDEVLAIDKGTAPTAVAGVRYVAVDVVREDLPLEGTDAVFYLAQSPAYRQFPEQAGDLLGVNVVGAVRACAAARKAGAGCFIYTSTGNVYAPSFAPLAENAPLRRDDPYALSKVMAEEALVLLQPHPRIVIARLFGVFGPRQRTMLPVVLRQKIERDEAIVLQPAPGEDAQTGGLRISFSYVDDVVRRLRDLAAKAVAGQPLPLAVNLAGPEPLSIRQFATALAEALKRRPRFEVAAAQRSFDLCADISLLQETCPGDFTPFDMAIRAAVE